MNYCNDKMRRLLATTLVMLFAVGCSSSNDPEPDPDPVNLVPVAAAGTDQLVSRNYNVLLDGGDSSDADGDTLTFIWTQTSGSDVGSLSGETPTFVAPADVGTLIFELVVNDGVDDSTADTLVIHVLENVNVAYFVDGDNGSDDTGNGAMETPYASIAKALCEVTQEQQDIYVMTRASDAVYDETADPCPGTGAEPRNTDQILTIPTGTSLYGGYDASWMRDVINNHAAVTTLHHGFIFTAVNTNAWFSGFNVAADDSPDPTSSAYVLSALGGTAGISIHDNELTAGDVAIGNANSPGTSYGLRVALMETATIERNIISAGFGGDGLDLAIVFAERASQGGAGSNGSATGGAGGDGSYPDYYTGGAGGNRGNFVLFCANSNVLGGNGSSGQVVNGGGGGGGAGGGCNTTGSGGVLGGEGSDGGGEAGGSSSGGINVYEDMGFFASFVNGNGITGLVGRSGHGGGGGGGGGAGGFIGDGWGGGGGGGGGGGAGGTGGTGGDGGGASIGLFIASVNTVLIDNNEITSGIGGNGATGGLGQLGGLGGPGGSGLSATAGDGGVGGVGGEGGKGGRGGAGGGGPSYGILFDGDVAPVISNNTIASNDGGDGGDGSTGGNGGNGGHSYAIYDYNTSDLIIPSLIANDRPIGTGGDGGTSSGGTAGDDGSSGVQNW